MKKTPQNIIVNIANDKEYTVLEIVEKMYNLADKKFNPIINKTNIKVSNAIDVSKLKEVFNFQPSCDLESGLCEVMDIDKKQIKKVLRRK